MSGDEIVHSGEIPGVNGSSCILGSINLVKYIIRIDGEYAFNFTALAADIPGIVKFMDDVVSLTKSGLDLFDNVKDLERKIGIGVMGLADILAFLRLPYDSQEARSLVDLILETIYKNANEASILLAKGKGPYPAFSDRSYDHILDRPQKPRRNAALLSVAPTGSISMVAQVNWSVEPFFSLAYIKNLRFGSDHVEDSVVVASKTFEHLVREIFEKDIADKILFDVASSGSFDVSDNYSDKTNEQIKEMKPWFKTAYEVSIMDHLKMMSVVQRWVDQSVSKTINLPSSCTVEDIENVLINAWKLGIKGFTVYRDSSRTEQVLLKGITNSSSDI